jgi:Protein of unknown function (DUF1572)
MPANLSTFESRPKDMSISTIFLQSVIHRLGFYKSLGEKTFDQLADEDFHFQPDDSSNSIAVIINHLSGNMISRWTNFLAEDGEKPWRLRDQEFESTHLGRIQLLQSWNKGWNCMLEALESLSEEDVQKMVLIRGESLDVVDAIHRQLAHCSYHIGQIVYLGKMVRQGAWKTLSIEKGKSEEFNRSLKGRIS